MKAVISEAAISQAGPAKPGARAGLPHVSASECVDDSSAQPGAGKTSEEVAGEGRHARE
jgi:hypothetical protein